MFMTENRSLFYFTFNLLSICERNVLLDGGCLYSMNKDEIVYSAQFSNM
uniref:Uncharacterized protein n=1 Tax=Anguilla anguilla TaxID=7936 RepID=A0A0E9QJD1_ANGAN